jgi:hypothetical protein
MRRRTFVTLAVPVSAVVAGEALAAEGGKAANAAARRRLTEADRLHCQTVVRPRGA